MFLFLFCFFLSDGRFLILSYIDYGKEGRHHLEQESNRQITMEGINGRLHPAVDGHSLGERWR